MSENLTITSIIPKKGMDIELDIESLAFGGMGISKINGKIIFVKNAIPDQRVLARITKKRKSYFEARKLSIIKESNFYTKPICIHFNDCGGCSFQNLNYKNQLHWKQQQINDLYNKMGNFKNIKSKPIIACQNQYNYRNKMEFSFSNKRWILNENDSGESKNFALGLHVSGRYDKILNIDNCDLQINICNDILNLIKIECLKHKIEPYDIKKHTGFLRHLMIRSGIATNEIMINFITSYEKTTLLKPIATKLFSKFSEIKCIVNNINTKKADIAFGEWEINLAGNNVIIDKIGDYEFEISANSFFQTNTLQAEVLYNVIKEECNLKGNEIVYDLYSGIGTISIFLSKYVKSIYAIELIETAVNDAKKNAKRNNINNIKFFCGDLKDILSKDNNLSSIPKPDIIIIDPPRAGMHKNTIKDINKLKPKKIVYCSCNPSTQVRDVVDLYKNGYQLKNIRPVDMFPNTPHIECVSTLEYTN